MSNGPFELFDIKEYNAGVEDRVREQDLMEQDLSTSGLYTVMFGLKALRAKGQAAQCASLVTGIELQNDGLLYEVKFSLLDSDLQPVKDMRNAFWNGYLLSKGANDKPVNTGYFIK